MPTAASSLDSCANWRTRSLVRGDPPRRFAESRCYNRFMPRSKAMAEVSVERFFQLALLGLVASGYLAVVGSGYLDLPTVVLTSVGLLFRAVLVTGALQLNVSDRAVVAATIAYIGFFPLDYLFLSREF